MADVAKLAGVSIQTVSRVHNDGDYVAPQTRERVLKAITMLGYQPNSAARTLVTGRSRTIGVASFEATLYGPAATLASIERAAVDEDYFTSIVTPQSLDHESLISAVERLQRQGLDGILVIAPLTTAGDTLPYIVTNVPLVAIETGPAKGVPVVGVDQYAGAVLATQYLLDLGHHTVHHLAGPPTFKAASERLIGWRQTLEAAGAPVPPPVDGAWSADAGYAAGKRLLDTETPTAVFSANDQMALGFLRALNEAGLPLSSTHLSVYIRFFCIELCYACLLSEGGAEEVLGSQRASGGLRPQQLFPFTGRIALTMPIGASTGEDLPL